VADRPQDPGQGSLHFILMQASWLLHSALLMHSGRQNGGCPWNSGKQEHEAFSFTTRQTEFGPHGDGRQGLAGGCSTMTAIIKSITQCKISSYFTLVFTLTRCFYFMAFDEWISSIGRPTCTEWIVIADVTIGSISASSRAWILTSLIDAGLTRKAF